MIAQIQVRRGTTAEWAAASPVVLAAGEQGYDTTLKKTKIGDGVTEWASLPWQNTLGNITSDGKVGTVADKTLMTGTDGLVVAKTMEEAISIWKFTNPNILHNWDFRNPVNQRAVTGEISTGAEFYDRWIRNSGTVTVNAGYLTLASGAVIEQRIEGNLLAGLVCTVSFEVGGTIYHGSGAFPTNNGTASVEVDGYPDITLGCATGYMFVLIPATSETSIKRVKCEMGFVSTLAYDPPMDFSVMQTICCRFYRMMRIAQSNYYRSTTYSHMNLAMPLVPEMRVTPTVSTWGWEMGNVGPFTPVTTGALVDRGYLRQIWFNSEYGQNNDPAYYVNVFVALNSDL